MEVRDLHQYMLEAMAGECDYRLVEEQHERYRRKHPDEVPVSKCPWVYMMDVPERELNVFYIALALDRGLVNEDAAHAYVLDNDVWDDVVAYWKGDMEHIEVSEALQRLHDVNLDEHEPVYRPSWM